MSYATFTHVQSQTGTASSATTTVATINGLNGVTSMRLLISGLTTETCGIQLSPDGTNYNGSSIKNVIDDSTGAIVAAVTLGNGMFTVPGPFSGLKLTKSAGAETATVRWIVNF